MKLAKASFALEENTMQSQRFDLCLFDVGLNHLMMVFEPRLDL